MRYLLDSAAHVLCGYRSAGAFQTDGVLGCVSHQRAAVRVQRGGIGLSGLGGPRQRRKALEHSARLEGRVPEGLAGEGAALLTGRGDRLLRSGYPALGHFHVQVQVAGTHTRPRH